MIRIVKWLEWQGRGIYELARKRKEKRRKIVLSFIAITADWDDRFSDFAERLDAGDLRRKRGHRAGIARGADAFLLRTLQYVARHGAESGRIHVARDRFGPVVLSVRFDTVSSADGAEIYDALLDSGIAVPSVPSPAPRSAPSSADAGAPPPAEPGAPDSAPSVAAGLGLGLTSTSKTLPAVDVAVVVHVPRAHASKSEANDRGGSSPGSAGGTPAAPVVPSPPSVGSPPAPDNGEAANVLGLVGLTPEQVHGRGGVGAPAWAKEIAALLADGVTANAVLAAYVGSPASAKPWEVFRELRDGVAKRRAADDDARRAREERRKKFEAKVDDLAKLTASQRAGYFETFDRYEGGPELRARYVEALKARGIDE